ncbi:MAG: fused MFS/spermidine synthase [Chloroflexi bacterium]|nr:fused MFS/spermidine synthase [Chloroflexota bacterium]
MSNDVMNAPARQTWLWQPNLIVFVSSACIMILELVAGRIIAPHVGSSLYTWTSVIGVVLAGITLGNYLGGRLADRWASLRFLGVVYILAALSSAGIVGLDRMYRVTPPEWSIVIEIVAFTAVLFFLPCTILGMISPIVVKLSLSDLAKTGSTVGKIYAAGAAGSIVGTFATGFWLISWFGTYTIVWGVAAVLLALGLFFLLGARWQSGIIALVLIAGGSLIALNQQWLVGPCVRETNYYCIKIIDRDEDGVPVRQLVLDHLVHSFVELNNPRKLVYGYEKTYAEVAQMWSARGKPVSVAMIGGGGYTFPRYMETVYPNSIIHVIEIDPGVTQVAHDLLAFRTDTKVVTYNEDARMFFARPPTMKYDLVLGDAFNHYQVPHHLTTKEFNDRVRAFLADDGVYIVNIIDGPYGEFARAYFHTLRQTFPNVYIAEGNYNWRQVSRSFFLLIGSNVPLDLDALKNFDGDDGDPLLSRLMAGPDQINRLLTEAPLITITDQYAPVDQMLESVFRDVMPAQ